MSIMNTGNVGIGTSTPVTKLDVSGNASVGGGVDNAGIQLIPYSAGRSLNISGTFGANGFGILNLISNNNEAAGQTLGSFIFAQKVSGKTGGNPGLKATITAVSSGSGGSVGGYGADLYFSTRSDNDGSAAGTERLRITSTGNVGIGTPSPAAKLDVNGGAKFTSAINLFDGAAATPSIVIDPVTAEIKINGNSVLTFGTGGSFPGAGAFSVGSNGQALVSTTTGQSMFVGRELGSAYAHAGGIFQAITDNATGSANYFFKGVTGGPSGTTNFSVRADGAGYFAGNVGIGTAVPDSPLQVAGKIHSAGLRVDNTGIGTGTSEFFDTSNASFALLASSNNSQYLAYLADSRNAGSGSWFTHSSFYARLATATYAGQFTDGTRTVTFANNSYAATFTGGIVGIGTSTPLSNTKLHIAHLSSSLNPVTIDVGGDGGILLRRTGGVSLPGNATVQVASYGALNLMSDNDVNLSPGNSPALTAKLTTGNVGIGTSSPTSKLDVNGGASIGTAVTSSNTSQVVLGRYNDLRTTDTTNNTTTNHTQGVFIVGTGTSTSARGNALRVLDDGTVLVKNSGDIAMGSFTNGPQP
jgi:hypothetical protein